MADVAAQRARLEAAQQAVANLQRELDADPARVELARKAYVALCAEVEKMSEAEREARRAMVQKMSSGVWSTGSSAG